MRYMNEIGAPARADWLDALATTAAVCGFKLENWYGVRIASDRAELETPPRARSGSPASRARSLGRY